MDLTAITDRRDRSVEQFAKSCYTSTPASVESLIDAKFNHLINRGLLSIYFADHKVSGQKDVWAISKKLLRLNGIDAFFSITRGVIPLLANQ
jgi:hypothetical protein